MSRRVDSMNRLAELADKRSDEAKFRLAQQQQRLISGQNQLDELIRFRDEYKVRLTGMAGISAQQLQNHHQFLQRLNEAIDYQRLVIEKQSRVLEQERMRWHSEHNRARALGTVASRFQNAENVLAEKQEQVQSDEYAQRVQKTPWLED